MVAGDNQPLEFRDISRELAGQRVSAMVVIDASRLDNFAQLGDQRLKCIRGRRGAAPLQLFQRVDGNR